MGYKLAFALALAFLALTSEAESLTILEAQWYLVRDASTNKDAPLENRAVALCWGQKFLARAFGGQEKVDAKPLWKAFREAWQKPEGPDLDSCKAELGAFVSASRALPSNVISVKSLPLEQPGGLYILQAMCTPPSQSMIAKSWCMLTPHGHMSIPAFSYGNIEGEPASVDVDARGGLVAYRMTFDRGLLQRLVPLLTEKYGQPVSASETLQNKLGAQFQNLIYRWTDAKGTVMTVATIDEVATDESSIEIHSASYVQLMEQWRQRSLEKARSNL